MNPNRARDLADFIEDQLPIVCDGLTEVEFDMESYFVKNDSCQTAACIAGSAAIMQSQRAKDGTFVLDGERLEDENVRQIAMNFLEIDEQTASALFEPYLFDSNLNIVPLSDLTKEQAVYVLNELSRLKLDGIVDTINASVVKRVWDRSQAIIGRRK